MDFETVSPEAFGASLQGLGLNILVSESPPRGAGAEIRLYQTDPDDAAARAEAAGGHALQAPTDKPHGLRETFILCANGYAWVASRSLAIAGAAQQG